MYHIGKAQLNTLLLHMISTDIILVLDIIHIIRLQLICRTYESNYLIEVYPYISSLKSIIYCKIMQQEWIPESSKTCITKEVEHMYTAEILYNQCLDGTPCVTYRKRKGLNKNYLSMSTICPLSMEEVHEVASFITLLNIFNSLHN